MDEQKKRLIELLLKTDPISSRDLNDDWGDGEIEDIADYLLANGVLAPPCKIGDTVYYITHVGKRKVKSAKVEKLYFGESRCKAFVFDKEELLDFTINIEDCFLTREEAEAALATKEKE